MHSKWDSDNRNIVFAGPEYTKEHKVYFKDTKKQQSRQFINCFLIIHVLSDLKVRDFLAGEKVIIKVYILQTENQLEITSLECVLLALF